MVTWEDINKANNQMVATDIKGRPYMEVNQRIKAFRMVYPQGFIRTQILSNVDGVCIMRAEVGYTEVVGNELVNIVLGVGTAYEKENSTFINRTSYIENCETSACGRALGMAGFGIDVSVASAEEVQNAILNQERIRPEHMRVIQDVYKGDDLQKLLELNHINKLEELPLTKAVEILQKLRDKQAKKGAANNDAR